MQKIIRPRHHVTSSEWNQTHSKTKLINTATCFPISSKVSPICWIKTSWLSTSSVRLKKWKRNSRTLRRLVLVVSSTQIRQSQLSPEIFRKSPWVMSSKLHSLPIAVKKASRTGVSWQNAIKVRDKLCKLQLQPCRLRSLRNQKARTSSIDNSSSNRWLPKSRSDKSWSSAMTSRRQRTWNRARRC